MAIIDTGFGYLEEAKASGDLPTDMVEVDLTGEGMDYPGWPPHGNAVAQMMHDMAPDAGLYLFNVGDVVDLGVAKDMCISYGINIINHSVSWFNENFYDGTGLVNDIANDARAHGILWVNAAGNFTCLHHWHGKATDPDGNGWINFPREEFQPLFFNSPDIATYYSLFDDGDDETLDICAEFAAFLGGTPTLDLALTWDDWPLSSNDYDMYLYDEDMNLVSESTNLQTGTQPPREHIVYSGPYSKIHPTPYYFDYAIFRLKIKRRADNKENMLMLFNGGDSSYMIPFRTDSSILSPADAESVMAVGAYYRREERLFNYSSHGPTIDGRLKPALVADADIPFYLNGQREIMGGTSSSSPIVAGAAAVILSRHPEYNADMIEGYLLSEAWDEYYRCNGACSVPRLGEPESDNEFGSGVMNLTHCSGFSIGYPQPPQYPVYYFIPRVDLVLDRKLLRKDDILKVKYGIVFDASLTRRPFDIYLGVRLPDGKIMSFDSNLNLSTKIAPTVRNVPLASNYFGKVANFSMQNVSPGKYVLLAACTFAGGFPGGSVFEVYDSACRQDMVCEYLTEESITVLP